MSEHVIRIVADADKLSPYYLLGFLRSEYCQEIIAKGVFGSVIDEIDPNFIGKIKVPIPKSKQLLEQIIQGIERAEDARNEAILGTHRASQQLDKRFSEAFAS